VPVAKLKCEDKYTYTAKERAFCENIALKRMTQYDSYCNAYNATKMKRETIDRKAHDVAYKDKIRARVEELRESVEEKAMAKATWTIEEATNKLIALVAEIENNEYINRSVSAKVDTLMKPLAELNKMYGYNKINTVNETTIKTELTLEDILCKTKSGQ
jgi:hypothetical protein